MKLQGFNKSIYNNPKMLEDMNWQWINDPSSKEFQTFENVSNMYYIRNKVFLVWFNDLNTLALDLIKGIELEIESRD